jgi:hypothetical protein
MNHRIATDLPDDRATRLLGPVRSTRRLLACGLIAGPLFIALVLVQALARPGFDLSRHPLSMLSLGDLGWIQVISFIGAGLLSIAYAIGIRRALHPGRAATWGPLLIGGWGLGLIAAGLFGPDPSFGFPPGAPAGTPESPSLHGTIHQLAFLVATLSITAACFVFVRRFASSSQSGWAAYSAATGVAVPVLIVIAGGLVSQGLAGAGVAYFAIPVVAWAWLGAVAVRLRRDLGDDEAPLA